MNSRGTFPPQGRGGGRGRGRGRGRGGFSHDRDSSHSISLSNVPTIQQVIPGAGVSIVLKEDQPTGHEVQGVVGELLTKGNHPRGIKVRLRDGRVGRVQRMWREGEVASLGAEVVKSEGAVEAQESGVIEKMGEMSIQRRAAPAPSRYSDFRNDGYEPPPRNPGLSLEDFVVVKKSKGKGKGNKKKMQDAEEEASEAVTGTATSTCPVCGEFEGDEAAVAHHVDGHFA